MLTFILSKIALLWKEIPTTLILWTSHEGNPHKDVKIFYTCYKNNSTQLVIAFIINKLFNTQIYNLI